MENRLWKKGLVLGIIVLFVGASVTPSISGLNKEPKEENKKLESVIGNGLVAYWKFDEGSGNKIYDEVGGHTGTIRFATWTSGISGYGLYFNADADRVEFSSPVLNTPPYSICVWVNPDGFGGNRYIISNGGESIQSYGFWLDSHGTSYNFGGYKNDGYGGGVHAQNPGSDWTFIVGTWDGTTGSDKVKIYINGELANTADTGWWDNGNAKNLLLGSPNKDPTSYGFLGIIDEVRIYDKVLSEQEIEELYGGDNQPPVADFTWTPTNPNPGETITFDASASYDPDGGTIELYEWDWDGNGLYEESHTTPTATHSWPIYGDYTVRLRVTDDEGDMDTVTKTVSVASGNHPPLKPDPPSGPINMYVGQTGQYATSTTDPDGDMVQYRFLWGDGTMSPWTSYTPSGSSMTVSKYWHKRGIFKVRAQARDTKGAKSFWSTFLIVNIQYEENQPPHTPHLLKPPHHIVAVPTTTKLIWIGGDPDTTDTVTYEIYLGKSSSPPKVDTISSSATKKIFTWDPPGDLESNTKYYWKIKATDNHGASKTSPVKYFTTKSEQWQLYKRFTNANKGNGFPEGFQGIRGGNWRKSPPTAMSYIKKTGAPGEGVPFSIIAWGWAGHSFTVPYQDGGTRPVKIKANINWKGKLDSDFGAKANEDIFLGIFEVQNPYIWDMIKIFEQQYSWSPPHYLWWLPPQTVSGSENIEEIINLKEKGEYIICALSWSNTVTTSVWLIDSYAMVDFWFDGGGVKYDYIGVLLK